MGAWSREPFGNDDANDWVYERADAADLSYVEAALDAVLEVDGYLEAPGASRAVAALRSLRSCSVRVPSRTRTRKKSTKTARLVSGSGFAGRLH